MKFSRFRNGVIFTGLALLVSACGQATPDVAAISTAAAQTVEARFTQMAEDTTTPTPKPKATRTPSQLKPTSTSTIITINNTPSGPVKPCLRASFSGSETIPDGTIIKPGETFSKTWRIKNLGTCTWDSGYSMVFDRGNAMGTTYSFPLPQVVYPEQEIDVSINLTAPASEGPYRGYWRIQTPWGGTLGFGEYDESIWVDIFVSSSSKPQYTVTSVIYNIVRDPTFGCQTNVLYTIYATLTVNGPTEVKYYWLKSDNTRETGKPIVFTQAGSKIVSVSWQLHRGASTNPRWVMLIVEAPNNQEFGKASFTYDCQ
jgi:hypothetical protein